MNLSLLKQAIELKEVELKQEGFTFDIAFTSLQSRAIKTLWLVLEEMDLMWIPVRKHWELNERHYGALQGKNKIEAVEKFGEAQVLAWRRAYATPPPALEPSDPRSPAGDPRYAGVPAAALPLTECLKDTVARVLPYWESTIAPQVRAGRRVLVAAHGNSLRALVKHLSHISDEDITGLEIPTGEPIVYDFDAALTPGERHYLKDR